ncbi:hypothetical protein FisN_10Lh100 [Fistulifera solaris]|uniref:Uncharacterized protein n=1 Tax=Fistulifera solaris TaxID=1519565 RepID=A0A1Z5JT79_FISSO|nr:hypothetical protein FisN_10Lh100 [Fistulifera solaris]|eukprot:GAX17243.1 hypothetical protein FisN_10Lh100 [Fistulifera solaris]
MQHSAHNAPNMAPFQRAPLQAVNARYPIRPEAGPQEQDSLAAKSSHRADMALPLMRTFTAPSEGRPQRPSPPDRAFHHQGEMHAYGGGVFPHSTPSSHPRNYNGHYSGMMPQMHNHMMYPQRQGRPFPSFHGMNHYPYQPNVMNYQSTPLAHGHFNRPVRNTPEFSYPPDPMHSRMQEIAMANSQSSDDHHNSPRSPSPPPAPPTKQVPSSAPPKIRTEKIEQKNKPPTHQRLEESFGKTLRDAQPSSTSAFHKVENGAPAKSAKATPSVQDASLLLGLRSNSASKSPIPGAIPHHDIALEEEATDPSSPSSGPPPCVIPDDYPKRLALSTDNLHLNSLHCFIRSELLELFVIEPGKDETFNTMTGRIGLQCVHCAAARVKDPKRENEATMAVFYPKSCNEIYRLVTNWTRCHLSKCRNLPPSVRQEWELRRAVDKSRGKTPYWAESARELGLVDCTQSRAGGVRFGSKVLKPQEHAKKGVPR